MPSFDVVSEVDRMEVKNAVDQAQRELSSRFDFKGSPRQLNWIPRPAQSSSRSMTARD